MVCLFSRRSSGYGSKGGKPKEDPRNVRSKPFQNSAIRNLLEVSLLACKLPLVVSKSHSNLGSVGSRMTHKK